MEIDDVEKDVLTDALKLLAENTDSPIKRMVARNLIEKAHYGDSHIRYFRFQRETLEDSVAERRRVNSLSDIIAVVKEREIENFGRQVTFNYRIDKKSLNDSARLSSLWADTHYVLADMHDGDYEYPTVVIGMCNFFE